MGSLRVLNLASECGRVYQLIHSQEQFVSVEGLKERGFCVDYDATVHFYDHCGSADANQRIPAVSTEFGLIVDVSVAEGMSADGLVLIVDGVESRFNALEELKAVWPDCHVMNGLCLPSRDIEVEAGSGLILGRYFSSYMEGIVVGKFAEIRLGEFELTEFVHYREFGVSFVELRELLCQRSLVYLAALKYALSQGRMDLNSANLSDFSPTEMVNMCAKDGTYDEFVCWVIDNAKSSTPECRNIFASSLDETSFIAVSSIRELMSDEHFSGLGETFRAELYALLSLRGLFRAILSDSLDVSPFHDVIDYFSANSHWGEYYSACNLIRDIESDSVDSSNSFPLGNVPVIAEQVLSEYPEDHALADGDVNGRRLNVRTMYLMAWNILKVVGEGSSNLSSIDRSLVSVLGDILPPDIVSSHAGELTRISEVSRFINIKHECSHYRSSQSRLTAVA
ncbi:hypothetical protein AB4254_08910 [Vibrio breoganii]